MDNTANLRSIIENRSDITVLTGFVNGTGLLCHFRAFGGRYIDRFRYYDTFFCSDADTSRIRRGFLCQYIAVPI